MDIGISLENARQTAKDLIKASVHPALWNDNVRFTQKLRQAIQQHPVASHPAIQHLNEDRFDKDSLIGVHLEYRHAIVQIFTDALLMAQHQSRQLEPRLSPGSKIYARFLLTLNDLDEFGFRPGSDQNGYYRGNPALSHYLLFESLLTEYGISLEQRNRFTPSPIASEVRAFLESSYSQFGTLVALLAVAEEEVVLFSPPLRHNSASVGMDVSRGYYFVHGTSHDGDAEAFDDDHEDDLWHILNQSLRPADHEPVFSACMRYCDLWTAFWDAQLARLSVAQDGTG
ncbi:MAG TPA: hypothetical protein VFN52_02175 [Acidiferrobacteraceae bacterium]|nr:hypothetical protein [Acidiferrobacteraceae bacterium]